MDYRIVGRIKRMCLKELRETLRDRRTLVTLILMPLLVYPLLSLALQRLILSSAGPSHPEYLVGVRTDEEYLWLGETLGLAAHLRQSDIYRPLRINRKNSRDSASFMGKHPAEWRVMMIEDGATNFLTEGKVDLTISINRLSSSRDEDETDEKLLAEPTAKKKSANGTSKESIGQESIPIDPEAVTGLRRDTEQLKPISYQFLVSFREDDSMSENALYELRNMLQTVNDYQASLMRARFGGSNFAPVDLIATSIDVKSSYKASLAAVIPLVLVLMTITGAVYPAIDLTAGERERGTMEALIATPVPKFALLFSKYVAVLVVAILTASANLVAMFVTLNVGGLGKALLGDAGFPLLSILQVFPLLIIFSAFFSAILLALCCVAKSFKEAQAYLIPVMLLSLGPGVLSLLPNIQLTTMMATIPIVNMILLARDTLSGGFEWVPALIAIVSTICYAICMMMVASMLFGRNAIPQNAETTWTTLVGIKSPRRSVPSVDQLLMYLACFFPIYFIASNSIRLGEASSIANQLTVNALATFVLFWAMPILFCMWRNIDRITTFKPIFNSRILLIVPGLVFLASGLWTVAHEIYVLSESLGIASLKAEQMEQLKSYKEALLRVPLWVILMTTAVVPAVAEETLFRGFVFRSLERVLKPLNAILISAALFGAFHVLSGSVLSIEKFLPTAFLGLVLGWLAWRTQSIFPGMIVHALHNGLLFSVVYYEKQIREFGIDVDNQRHLPWTWFVGGIVLVTIGWGIVAITYRNREGNAKLVVPEIAG